LDKIFGGIREWISRQAYTLHLFTFFMSPKESALIDKNQHIYNWNLFLYESESVMHQTKRFYELNGVGGGKVKKKKN